MKTSDKQWLFLQDVAKLIIYAESINIKLTGGELFRSIEQQAIYFNSIPPKTKTMKSKHLERLAIDFNFFIDDRLTWQLEDVRALGVYWESLSDKNEAGMFWKWKDLPHFQRNN